MAELVMKRHMPLTDRWRYEDGLILKAIERVWRSTEADRFHHYVNENVDRFVGLAGQIDTYGSLEYNLDQINPGRLPFSLYERAGDDRYRNEHAQREKLVAILRDAVAALVAVQDGETGLWY